MAENQIHPEDALSEAGASSGYYEVVGASYSPADNAAGTPATATIDLSTVDHTGCLLTHNYATGETTLKWDSEPLDREMYGTADDVDVAIEDITRGQLDHSALFEAFQTQMGAGSRAGS
ncbi:hypothetical protein [Arthrobacter sp. ES1]|uniref:hypothetical protein n=1 Tax=Arthrobacter sp. ES1 TaxID=1897056 RepID=UPI001CFFD31C|nr:hypothetical protein [Arthrobacter sp. ES1]MCB5280552.1 hypothetical protein [Arthrobacter sp. ES1]